MITKLKDDLYALIAKDFSLRQFDVSMYTEYGTTYNAFLLKGSKHTVVFDGYKQPFIDEYIRDLKSLVPIEKIDYLIVQHTEPDHSSSIIKVLEIHPDITIVGSLMAITMVKELVNRPFKSLIVKDKDTLDIGGKTLIFYVLPNIHWPDTMVTYCQDIQTVFTCDFFGSHYASEANLLSEVKNYEYYKKAFFNYYQSIMFPFPSFVNKALTQLQSLSFDMIATSHGPIIDQDIDNKFADYFYWSKVITKESPPLVIIVYASAYGYTKLLAETIKEQLKLENLNVVSYDLAITDYREIYNRLMSASGLLVGSTTIVQDMVPPVADFLSRLTPSRHSHIPASSFGSYGWSGEAVNHILQRLTQLRYKINDQGFKIKLYPSLQQLDACRQFGKQFAQSVKQQFNVANK
jgi:NADH oxidase (H2O-forming)